MSAVYNNQPCSSDAAFIRETTFSLLLSHSPAQRKRIFPHNRDLTALSQLWVS